MASLNVRNLPEHVQQRLRMRAARAGRSMEAEAREILTKAAAQRRAVIGVAELQSFVAKLYKGRTPSGVVDELLEERRREADRE